LLPFTILSDDDDDDEKTKVLKDNSPLIDRQLAENLEMKKTIDII
jgi:ribosome-binding factor A